MPLDQLGFVASDPDPFRPGDAMPQRSVRPPMPCGKSIQGRLYGLARSAGFGNRVDGFLDNLGQVGDIALEVRLPRAAPKNIQVLRRGRTPA